MSVEQLKLMASPETGTEQARWKQRWGENELNKQQKKTTDCVIFLWQ